MKIQDLKNKSPEELKKLLIEKRAELGRLKFELANKQLKDVSKFKKHRQTIARISTLLTR